MHHRTEYGAVFGRCHDAGGGQCRYRVQRLGKTGSAELDDAPPHGWFIISLTDEQAPPYTIAVFLENCGGASYAKTLVATLPTIISWRRCVVMQNFFQYLLLASFLACSFFVLYRRRTVRYGLIVETSREPCWLTTAGPGDHLRPQPKCRCPAARPPRSPGSRRCSAMTPNPTRLSLGPRQGNRARLALSRIAVPGSHCRGCAARPMPMGVWSRSLPQAFSCSGW